jgi:spore coat polysaccharide biosynthesis protein SpsF
MNKVAIIQARMSSSRLPGKVMLDIAGQPMLQRVINRAKRSKLIDRVAVATTSDPSDDILELFCQKQALPCYRGSLVDVLDRFYQAARQYRADVIIRLTADCPLLDPDLLDLTVSAFLSPQIKDGEKLQFNLDSSVAPGRFDFAANRLPPPWQRTLPIGLDVEVCSYAALEIAWKEADQLYQREHVMPYLYEGVVFSNIKPTRDEWHIEHGSTPRDFMVALLNHKPDYGNLRWTVDTPADLEFVRQVYAHFDGREDFGWQDTLALLKQKPELAAINAQVKHKSAFDVDQRTGAA